MNRKRLATVWLDGCSGCHMSFLDIDERLLDLADSVELVYSPLVDRKDFPDSVDITLIEGAVSSEGDLAKIKHIRAHTKLLISLGDCAVTGNVPALRNTISTESVLRRVYLDPALHNPQLPGADVPPLLSQVRPIHSVVHVDVYIPGCPPSSETIFYALTELLAGRQPDFTGKTRFGA
jgi:NAD-reducing hydrogenase small subunit